MFEISIFNAMIAELDDGSMKKIMTRVFINISWYVGYYII